MREITRHPADGVTRLDLRGSRESVRSRLERLDRDGLLVHADERVLVDRATGDVIVRATVLEHARQARPEPHRVSTPVAVTAVLGGTAVGLAGMWAVCLAVAALAPYLAVAVVGVLLLGGGGCVTVVTVRHRH